MSNSTITLQNVLNLASTHADLLPLANVGGYSNEPGLSLCNDALSELFSSPNDWKFNRNEMTLLVTAMNKQDYVFAGATAFTLGSTSTGVGIGLASTPSITESSFTVTVTTLEAHRFSVGDVVYMTGNTVAAYNSTFTDDGNATGWSGGWTVLTVPTTTSFTFTHATSGLASSGAAGITDYGYLTSATMVEMNNTSSPQNSRIVQTRRELVPWSKVANPEEVAVMTDNGDGTLKIRFLWVPGSTIWGAKLIYQAAAPLKTALTDTWAPFPDQYSSVFRQALLYRMYRYLNSPRADAEYQKLQQEINRTQAGDDAEQTNVFLSPQDSIMDSQFWGGW